MNDYKSIQELIVKAALYDGVSTTISADELIGGIDVLKITFQKDNRYNVAHIDTVQGFRDHEEMVLNICKRALLKLLFAPYDEIEVNKENHPC